VSYNLPKFCPNATWNPNATTFAGQTFLGDKPVYVFVNNLNTVYIVVSGTSLVQVWLQGNVTPTRNISNGLDKPMSVFVNFVGDMYIDNRKSSKRVEKWSANSSTGQSVMSVTNSCTGLFIDLNETLYCSMANSHQVVKRSLNSSGTTVVVAAGNGTGGAAANDLNGPQGIFVDFQFKLYVADTDNDRIQTFMPGNLTGTTVCVNITSASPTTLSKPTGVVLDADGYLFIVDMNNNRIIGQSSNGFRCVAGCGASGSSQNQLKHPQALSFDSNGNLFVADKQNDRVQKFWLLTNSCSE
jgi:hypothetical protein